MRTAAVIRSQVAVTAAGVCILGTMLFAEGAFGQAPSAPTADQTGSTAEITTHETQPTFKLRVERNLVLVRAVVRDSTGRAIGSLRKEDFRVLDSGKPQEITLFSIETAAAKPPAAVSVAQQKEGPIQPEAASIPTAPQRYLGMFFDDVHLVFEDVVRTRDAAERYLAGALLAGDRAAVFTASGQVMLDFTDDRSKLHDALFRLHPRPINQKELTPCPDILDYQALRIVNQNDVSALDIATEETLLCQYDGERRYLAVARLQAQGEAVRVLNRMESQSEYSLRGLEQLVRRLSVMPGQRNIVMVSPGFLILTQQTRVGEIVERALRSNVIIGTLDSKGLYAPVPSGDASQHVTVIVTRPDLNGQKSMIQLESLNLEVDVLNGLASDTGGTFFHNSNDYDEGFRKVGGLPEAYYVLGFSPQNLKLDGHFHPLKVKLANSAGLTIQARRGYYAPKKPQDAAEQAKAEIEEAIFSQDEISELPSDMHTQFFRANNEDSKLAVLTYIDLHLLRFRKEEGRNLNNLTVIIAVFDRDGKILSVKEKTLQLRLREMSLERLAKTGVTMKTSFDVKPGTYMVRQVIRDTEGAQLSGMTRTVEIPY